MNLNLPGLIDLTPVFAVFAVLAGSAFSTSNALQWARNLFLDSLTAKMSDTQRNELLRTLLFLLNVGVVLGIALFMHFALSPQLLLSVVIGASGSSIGAHLSYGYTQKTPPTLPEPSEIPVDGPGLPPPTDTPAAAAARAA